MCVFFLFFTTKIAILSSGSGNKMCVFFQKCDKKFEESAQDSAIWGVPKCGTYQNSEAIKFSHAKNPRENVLFLRIFISPPNIPARKTGIYAKPQPDNNTIRQIRYVSMRNHSQITIPSARLDTLVAHFKLPPDKQNSTPPPDFSRPGVLPHTHPPITFRWVMK